MQIKVTFTEMSHFILNCLFSELSVDQEIQIKMTKMYLVHEHFDLFYCRSLDMSIQYQSHWKHV